jgi:hypothetical protein
MSLRSRAATIAKTANFTVDIVAAKDGTRFTNRAAVGAVTFTLPTPQTGVNSWDGYWLEFFGVADQTITVTAAAGKAVAINNAACASLSMSTAGQKIGGKIVARWDAAAGKWHLEGDTSGITYTVA